MMIGQQTHLTRPQTELQRQLGLASSTALIVGEVIAVGIFLTPAAMAKSLGSPFWLLLVWLVMGVMALCGALCYGELAARFPESGGGYVYLREAYGEQLAFLYGWKCFFVMDPGITAALAMGMASYAAYLIELSPFAQKFVAIATILALAAANIFGVRLGAQLMRSFTFLKLGLLAFIVLWGFALQLGDWSNFTPFVEQRAGSAPLMGALAGGYVAAFFSFGGWWDVSKLAGEVREAERNLPRALMLGVALVTGVYILTSAAFFYLVPLAHVTDGETFAAQAGEALFGAAGGKIFAAIVVISVLSSLAGLIMAAPRVYYAMARDGLFFHAAAAIHPRFGTPVIAIACQAALASLFVALGTFNQIIAFFIFVTVCFIALTVASVFVLRKKSERAFEKPEYLAIPPLRGVRGVLLGIISKAKNILESAKRNTANLNIVVAPKNTPPPPPQGGTFQMPSGRATAFKAPGYPITPVIFLALVAVLLFLLASQNAKQAFLGVGLVALGYPVYHFIFRKT